MYLKVKKDVLRKLCQDGLPKVKIYESCAYYLLEYEKLLSENEKRQKSLKEITEASKKLKANKEEFSFRDITNEKKLLMESSNLKSIELLKNIEKVKKDKQNLIKNDIISIENLKLGTKIVQADESLNVKDIKSMEKYFSQRNEILINNIQPTLPEKRQYISMNLSFFDKENEKELAAYMDKINSISSKIAENQDKNQNSSQKLNDSIKSKGKESLNNSIKKEDLKKSLKPKKKTDSVTSNERASPTFVRNDEQSLEGSNELGQEINNQKDNLSMSRQSKENSLNQSQKIGSVHDDVEQNAEEEENVELSENHRNEDNEHPNEVNE